MMKVVAILVILSVCVILTAAAKGKDKAPKILKADLPFIGCEVCERAMREVTNQMRDKRSATKAKLEEIEIVELIDNVCNPKNEYGDWIRGVDIVEKKISGKKIVKLVDPGGAAKCEEECATIAKSCTDIFEEEIDRDDLSGWLYYNKLPSQEIEDRVCKKISKRCAGKPKALQISRQNFPFNKLSQEDIEMEALMAKMEGMGMGGMNVFSRDDIADMVDPNGDKDPDDDEDSGPSGSSEF